MRWRVDMNGCIRCMSIAGASKLGSRWPWLDVQGTSRYYVLLGWENQ
jgi:hypothetical protein